VDSILELLKGKLTEEDLENVKSAFDSEVQGLKAKNAELIGKIKRVRDTSQDKPEKLYELEDELETVKSQLREGASKFERELKKALAEKEKLAAELTGRTEAYKRAEANRALTNALAGKVKDPILLKASLSMLSNGLEVLEESGNFKVGMKTEKGFTDLNDYVESWSQTEEGKRFVAAPTNSGGNANAPTLEGDKTKGSFTREELKTSEGRKAFAVAQSKGLNPVITE
jgi:uncharacterized protein YoxC